MLIQLITGIQKENTYQDILDDKFRRGYRGLERLSNEINTIPDGDQKYQMQ